MLNFIFKRTIYSVFIILGVILTTFILFKIAAGDPAEAISGKNSSPREIEQLRISLGANKPIFCGNWQKTEAFPTIQFKKQPEKKIPVSSLTINANFKSPAKKLLMVIKGKGNYSVKNIKKNNFTINKKNTITKIIFSKIPTDKIILDFNKPFKDITFYIPTKSFFDSQFIQSLNEIVTFKNSFPYISFFNFGNTLMTRESVTKVIKNGISPSLILMLPIFIGEIIFGIILALVATAFKDSFIDRSIAVLSIATMSISYLVLIILGQWYLGFYYNLFPVWGFNSCYHLVLPIIIGIISGLGGGVRFYRTVFVNELNKEYLRTAKAKGVSSINIFQKHLFRNALIPIITKASASLPFLFTGSLLLESYFGIPGLGYIGLEALQNSDLQLLKAIVIISALLYVVINLITDITYAWADPRIRIK